MSERSRTRRMIMLEGPGLENMSRDQLANFIRSLGDRGMTATVLPAKPAEQPVPDVQTFERIVQDLKLAGKDDLYAFSERATYHTRVATHLWNGLRRAGKYYPLTPQSWAWADQEIDHPIFYYDPDLVASEFAGKCQAAQLDLKKGFIPADVPFHIQRELAFTNIRNRSRLDMYSLHEVLANDALISYPGIGNASLQLARDFCSHILGVSVQPVPTRG